MEVKVKVGQAEMTLLNGTMVRNVYQPMYFDVGKMDNGNKVLFYYTDATNVVDYVGTIIDNLPGFAAQYLENVLLSNQNVLVRLWYVPGADASSYEIYYDANCEDDLESIINWMSANNDWAASTYRYTEIIEGHQKCVGA